MQRHHRSTWPARKVAPVLVLLALACIPPGEGGVYYVSSRPPSPRVELRVSAPGPGYVWIGGYWSWSSRSYEWVPGRWSRPEGRSRHWNNGRWAHSRRGWYWIEGHWR